MPRKPVVFPIGLHLSLAARVVARSFDGALGEAGGSLPVWLVLLSVTTNPGAAQRQLAATLGLGEATLTHHLNAMESDGLITRRRDPTNRRVHVVEATPAGAERFGVLRQAALAYDRRLRRGIKEAELAGLHELLDRLVHNAGGPGAGPAWSGLAAPDVTGPR